MSGYKDNGKFYLAHFKSMDILNDDWGKIEKKLNLAYDWYRIDTGSYILYTSKNANQWYNIMEDIFEKRPHMFFCSLDVSDRQGWMAQGFWDWLKEKKRSG